MRSMRERGFSYAWTALVMMFLVVASIEPAWD